MGVSGYDSAVEAAGAGGGGDERNEPVKYHTTYDCAFHPEGLDRDAIPDGRGACTAVLIGSLLYPPSGEYSAMFISRDGRTGEEMAPAEIWKAWVMLAKVLADDDGLSAGKRELAGAVWAAVSEVVMKDSRRG